MCLDKNTKRRRRRRRGMWTRSFSSFLDSKTFGFALFTSIIGFTCSVVLISVVM